MIADNDENNPEAMPLFLTADVPGKAILDFYHRLAEAKRKRAEALKEKA